MGKRALEWFARKILWIVAWIVCSTLRITRINDEHFDEQKKKGGAFVVSFWHGAMLIGWFVHRPRLGHHVAALVSQSKDGELLSSVLGQWGYTMIRGSSHVGGHEAMQMMVDAIGEGNSLCVTPDGPTGPRHRMKMGAVRAAQRAQVPLFLVGFAIRKKKMLASWDGFEIPAPFTDVSAWYSDPIIVSPELQGAALAGFLLETESQLNELTEKAERSLSEHL